MFNTVPGPVLPASAAPLCDVLATTATIGLRELLDRVASVPPDEAIGALHELVRHDLVVVTDASNGAAPARGGAQRARAAAGR